MPMYFHSSLLEGAAFQLTPGAGMTGDAVSVDAWGDVDSVVEMQAYGGRVNVVEASITSIEEGNAVVRSDGKTTLDLRALTASTSIPALLSGGQQAMVHASAIAVRLGHPSGRHYKLPLDTNKRFVCEPGQHHRKWYLSRSSDALTKAQIAADAGVSEATVTGAWLLTRPQYGGTEATKIHADLFSVIRTFIQGNPGRSDHYRLDRGYDYSTLVWTELCGEDELHPALIGAFGTGADPVIKLVSNFLSLPFVVLQDVKTTRDAVQTWYGYSFAFDHVDFGLAAYPENTINCTFHECTILAPWYDAPKQVSGDNRWTANGNHLTGVYMSLSEGILVDSCLIDHAGWDEGYDYNGSAAMPMPMSKYSHALYFSGDTFDITIRNNLLSRSASCGVQMRSGLHLEGNLLIDNNVGVAANTGAPSQFNNVIDNVIYSAGYKRVAYEEGGYDWGFDVNGPLSSMVGNVIAHGKNPDDPTEDYKTVNWHDGVSVSAKLADDTQVWKWGAASRNVGGLNPTVLDETTIQRFAGIKAGQASRTIPQFVADTAAAPSIGAVVREGIEWTKSRFGNPIPSRTTPADLVFRPDQRTEGFRWDNRLNWSSKDLPGTHVADSADLDGHDVLFGLVDTSIAALHSRGGSLDVTSSRLQIGTLADAARLRVSAAGQIWIGGADHALSAEVISGRLALTGAAANLDLLVTAGQVLLGPDCTAQTMVIDGLRPQVGWDGTGVATLTIEDSLEFKRGIVVTAENGMEKIRYVYAHVGKAVTGSVSGFTARIAGVERIHDRGGSYKIWLSDIVGTPQVGDVITVAPRKEGNGTNTPTQITILSVGASGIAPLQRFRSGAIGTGLVEPTVTATLTLAATAQIVLPTGLPAGTHDLTGPGVAVVNNGAILPADVALTGGKLVMTVS